jgi:hypothetical protein
MIGIRPLDARAKLSQRAVPFTFRAADLPQERVMLRPESGVVLPRPFEFRLRSPSGRRGSGFRPPRWLLRAERQPRLRPLRPCRAHWFVRQSAPGRCPRPHGPGRHGGRAAVPAQRLRRTRAAASPRAAAAARTCLTISISRSRCPPPRPASGGQPTVLPGRGAPPRSQGVPRPSSSGVSSLVSLSGTERNRRSGSLFWSGMIYGPCGRPRHPTGPARPARIPAEHRRKRALPRRTS